MTQERLVPHNHIGSEEPPRKEVVFQVGGIVISGYPGTGKSRVIESLAKRYGIPPLRKIKVGATLRRRARTTYREHILDYFERPQEEDKTLDNAQLKLFESAAPSSPFILESKLGGFLVYKMRQEYVRQDKTPPQIVTILFHGNEDVLKERVFRRERKKHPKLTRQTCDEMTTRRQRKDQKQWAKAHPEYPELQVIDPLSPENRGMYDMALDTTYLKPVQVAEQIHSLLLQHGCVEEASPF